MKPARTLISMRPSISTRDSHNTTSLVPRRSKGDPLHIITLFFIIPQTKEHESLSAQELSGLVGVSIMLASERYVNYMYMTLYFGGKVVKTVGVLQMSPLMEMNLMYQDHLIIVCHWAYTVYIYSYMYSVVSLHGDSMCRLLVTEKAGTLCRDDSVEGLRFYPNKFLEM